MTEKGKKKNKSGLISPVNSGYVVKFSKQIMKKTFWSRRFLVLDKSGKLWYFKNDNPSSSAKKNRPIQVKGRRFWRSTFKGHCIKVDKYPKPFYFYIDDKSVPKNRTKSELYEEWISKMIEVGGRYSRYLLVDDYLTHQNASVSTKLIKDWKKENVQEWLSHLPCENDKSFLDLYSENFKSIREGNILLEMASNEKKVISAVGIKNTVHQSQLQQYLKFLKPNIKFNTNSQVVFRKLFRILHPSCQQQQPQLSNEFCANKFISQIEKFSRYLSDQDMILDTYLSCEYSTIVLEDRIMKGVFDEEEEEEEEESEGEVDNRKKKKKKKKEYDYGLLCLGCYFDEDGGSRRRNNDRDQRRGRPKRNHDSRKKKEKVIKRPYILPVKIIISHLPFVNEEFRRRISKDNNIYKTFLSPVVHGCPFEDLKNDDDDTASEKKDEQNDNKNDSPNNNNNNNKTPRYVKKLKHDLQFRTGLVIGPWYFEWEESSSLIIPRRADGQFSAYLGFFDYLGLIEFTEKKEVKKFMNIISSLCCSYNTQKLFDPITCNNQHFIEDVMRRMGVTNDEVLKNFFDLMNRNGGGRIGTVVPLNDLFYETFKFQSFPNGFVEFGNHIELDLFVNVLQNEDVISLRTDFTREIMLMTNFEFAFRIRNYRYPYRGLCYKPVDSVRDFFGGGNNQCPLGQNMYKYLRRIFNWKKYNMEGHQEMERLHNENCIIVHRSNGQFEQYKMEIGMSLHSHSFSWNRYDEENNTRIRLQTESVSSPYQEFHEILYFGNPINKLVASLGYGKIAIISSLDLQDEFQVIDLAEHTAGVTQRYKIRVVGLLKWDRTTFLVLLFHNDNRLNSCRVFSYSFRYYGMDNYSPTTTTPVQQHPLLSSYDSTDLRCSQNFEVVSFTLSNDSCEECKKLRKMGVEIPEKEEDDDDGLIDLFMIDGSDRMIFVSYQNKKIIKEITQPKNDNICPRILSKRFDKSVLCIGFEKVQVFSYDTFFISLEFPFSEYVQNEIKKSASSPNSRYHPIRTSFIAESFLNPKKLDEEIIVCCCPNFLLFVKIKRGWQGPTEYIMKIRNLSSISLLVLKSTYLCVGSSRGMFSLFHMDIPNLDYDEAVISTTKKESPYYQRVKKRDGWIDCTNMYQIRKHYNGITGMAVLKDNERSDNNIHLKEDFSEYLVTSSTDGHLVKNKLKGLNLVRDGRVLVEMDRKDVLERTRFLIESSEGDVIFEGISLGSCINIQMMNQTFEFVLKSFLMSK